MLAGSPCRADRRGRRDPSPADSCGRRRSPLARGRRTRASAKRRSSAARRLALPASAVAEHPLRRRRPKQYRWRSRCRARRASRACWRPAGDSRGHRPPPAAAIAGSSFYFLDGLPRPSRRAVPRHPLARRRPPPFASRACAASTSTPSAATSPSCGEQVHGRPLIWLDNAATTQKPQSVIDRLVHFYRHENSNIHRAAHELAARATDAYEEAREKVRRFLNASSADEIVFVRGATEAINLVAQSWGRQNIGAGDEIVITWLEHHANIVPWQQLCTGDGRASARRSGRRSRPGAARRVREAARPAHAAGRVHPGLERARHHHAGAADGRDGAPVRRARAGRRRPGASRTCAIDVQALDCDLYVFSGHKVFAPTGIGVLYGKARGSRGDAALAGRRQHDQGRDLRADRVPCAARALRGRHRQHRRRGRPRRCDRLSASGSASRTSAATSTSCSPMPRRALSDIPGLRLIGTAPEKAAVLSFVLDGVPQRGRRRGAQPRRDRRPCGPSLRPADPPPLRRRKHGPAVAGVLQHLRRDRCAGGGAAADREPQPAYRMSGIGDQGEDRTPCFARRSIT